MSSSFRHIKVDQEIIEKAKKLHDIEVTTYNGDIIDHSWVHEAKRKAKMLKPKECRGILDDAVQLIGNTPVVKLSRFARHHGLQCELVAKLEFFNPCGSIKERIAKSMIESAEEKGVIRPNESTLIEPTSGNTGIGLGMVGAVKGYNVIITLPDKMSDEKMRILQLLGADVVRTPTDVDSADIKSHIGLSEQLLRVIPSSVKLDQYRNEFNPIVHYTDTAAEILQQCQGKLDMIVIGAGTGGTLTGIAERLKEELPSCKIIGVDPVGSILAHSQSVETSFYEVEGIGYDFVPETLKRSVVDKWVKTNDCESFSLCRELILLEGLLVGGSSGAALAGVLKEAHSLTENQRCLVILPDSIRNYMSKFASDSWMYDKGFLPLSKVMPRLDIPSCGSLLVRDLQLTVPPVASPESTIMEIKQMILDDGNMHRFAVILENEMNNEGHVRGVMTTNMIIKLLNLKLGKTLVKNNLRSIGNIRKITADTSIDSVMVLLKEYPYLLVTRRTRDEKEIIEGVVTELNVLRVL